MTKTYWMPGSLKDLSFGYWALIKSSPAVLNCLTQLKGGLRCTKCTLGSVCFPHSFCAVNLVADQNERCSGFLV